MSLTIGRVGLDVDLPHPEAWDTDGDHVSISGSLYARTPAEAKALRQQLLGYVNNQDEPVIPVTWSDDPTVAGYYRLTSATVSMLPASLTVGWFPFTVELQRIVGYAGPTIETRIVGAVRTNVSSITSANAVSAVGVPDSVGEFYDTSAPGSSNVFTRTAVDGTVRLVKSGTYTRRQSWAVAPKDYYQSAATIEVGSPLRVVVGQQIPSEMTSWRLSNGLVRVVPNASNGIDVSAWDGTQWESKSFVGTLAGISGSGAFTLPVSLRVLRNSPEECIIRLAVNVTSTVLTALGTGSTRAEIDIALRRGERLPRVFLSSDVSAIYGVKCATTEAATAITGGIRATSNDSAGNRYVIAYTQTVASDTTAGGISLSVSAMTFSYAVGLEVGGSGAATNDQAQNLVYQYMVAGSEVQVVTVR